ncbi:MAG: bifunctional hydroxymethylpyrimidine kinase/phosphomethylpyrimidine kinase [Flectobacillus sp.]|uniref:bifunctional hydroxymethylpyrimidine kinase/phosphomethylpyrimidine kinase n=1 Tax=Flectobacillus sp. TaxID=50419 RepID=UPI003B9C2540
MKKTYFPVLSIAGSDPSSGAGIQADLITIAALGGYACTAITAVTIQNTLGVSGIYPIPAQAVREQIEAIMTDIKPLAIKIGMLHRTEVVREVIDVLSAYPKVPIVLDPVFLSTSGYTLLDEEGIHLMITQLFPLVTVLTPNLQEASWILGREITEKEQMPSAAKDLLNLGIQNVLLKGGHLEEDTLSDCLIKSTGELFFMEHPKIASKNTRGTGCTLSSAIAVNLAQGFSVEYAVERATAYVLKSIEGGKDYQLGEGSGPLKHI